MFVSQTVFFKLLLFWNLWKMSSFLSARGKNRRRFDGRALFMKALTWKKHLEEKIQNYFRFVETEAVFFCFFGPPKDFAVYSSSSLPFLLLNLYQTLAANSS